MLSLTYLMCPWHAHSFALIVSLEYLPNFIVMKNDYNPKRYRFWNITSCLYLCVRILIKKTREVLKAIVQLTNAVHFINRDESKIFKEKISLCIPEKSFAFLSLIFVVCTCLLLGLATTRTELIKPKQDWFQKY